MAAHEHRKKDAFHSAVPEDVRRRRVISIVLLAAIAVLFLLITYFVGLPLVREFRENPETFRDYVKSHGALGPLMMMGIMALQVIVAIIPGEPFELGAGFVFGWLDGSLLCLAGSAVATALVYLAVRKWGVKLVEAFFPREKILRYSFMQNEKKLNLLVFILFLIPGTPKDLITYLVGLTPMKLVTLLILTTVARIPSVVSSTVTGNFAQNQRYKAAIITYAITIAISAVCILWYRRISRAEKRDSAKDRPAHE